MTRSGDRSAIAIKSSDPGQLQQRRVRRLAEIDALAQATRPSVAAPAAGQAAVGLGAERLDDRLQSIRESAAGRGAGGERDEELTGPRRSSRGSRERARRDSGVGAGETRREDLDEKRGADAFVAAGGGHRAPHGGGPDGGAAAP